MSPLLPKADIPDLVDDLGRRCLLLELKRTLAGRASMSVTEKLVAPVTQWHNRDARV